MKRRIELVSSNGKDQRKKVGVIIALVMIFLFMVFDVYVISTKEAITPKLLAGGSFILFFGLFVLSFKQIIRGNS